MCLVSVRLVVVADVLPIDWECVPANHAASATTSVPLDPTVTLPVNSAESVSTPSWFSPARWPPSASISSTWVHVSE